MLVLVLSPKTNEMYGDMGKEKGRSFLSTKCQPLKQIMCSHHEEAITDYTKWFSVVDTPINSL